MHSAMKWLPKISMHVKTPMCQTRNGYLHKEGKVESFLLSEVVRLVMSKVIR